MITVTRFNNQELYINPHLIELIEATPDTVITLTTGRKLVVKDTIPDLVDRIVKYHQLISDQGASYSIPLVEEE